MLAYITFVLPTYNEETNIVPLIKEIFSFDNKYQIEIIVVDDNSTDKTQNLVREFSKTDIRVRLINRLGRYGLSSAICEGCLNSNGDVIAIMDSDGQHEVKSVYQSIEYLLNSGNDLIIGSRFKKGSSIIVPNICSPPQIPIILPLFEYSVMSSNRPDFSRNS